MSFAPEQSYRSDSPADSVDDYPDTEYQPTASDDGDPFELMRVRSAKTKTKDGAPSFVRKHRTALIGTAATVVGLVVVSAVAIGLLTGQSGDDSTTTQADAVASSPADVSDPAAVADACPSLSDGAVTTGNDAGDQKTGPGAIKAFNWGYYVERSARAAREVAAPNAVAREGVLQTFIDQVPEGSTHCLSITDEGNGTYAVVLTEIPPDPDAAPIVYPQIIKTIRTDGKVFIASITSEE
ncbi:MAG: hypothetical protein SW127_10595 [Actinomycetota bacterium]|nr:hypothetical protein [Actinomycetota bacterium]